MNKDMIPSSFVKPRALTANLRKATNALETLLCLRYYYRRRFGVEGAMKCWHLVITQNSETLEKTISVEHDKRVYYTPFMFTSEEEARAFLAHPGVEAMIYDLFF